MPRKTATNSATLNPTAASMLGFLHHGPASGWDLATKAQRTIGEFWNVTRSQVYRELKLLDSAGYVTARNGGARDRQPYHITSSGRAAFAEWIRGYRGRFLMRWPLALRLELMVANQRRFDRELGVEDVFALRGRDELGQCLGRLIRRDLDVNHDSGVSRSGRERHSSTCCRLAVAVATSSQRDARP